MIDIWPAIDLISNKSVRLTEGDYATSEVMGRTPAEAIHFYNQFEQVKRIHIVDLIGAKTKQPAEKDFITSLIQAAKHPVEIGGGIRSEETIRYYLNNGVDYVIIGTRGLTDTPWLKRMTEQFPGKIYLGLDAQHDQVAINGWIEKANKTIFSVIDDVRDIDLGGIIYTDISKDGKMNGPNFDLTEGLVSYSPHPIIASGGIRHQKDLKRLDMAGVSAAIVGKAANTDTFWEEIK